MNFFLRIMAVWTHALAMHVFFFSHLRGVTRRIDYHRVHGENSSCTKMATWKPNQLEKMARGTLVSLRIENGTKPYEEKEQLSQNKKIKAKIRRTTTN